VIPWYHFGYHTGITPVSFGIKKGPLVIPAVSSSNTPFLLPLDLLD